MPTEAEAKAAVKTALSEATWPAPAPALVFANTGPNAKGEYLLVHFRFDRSEQRTMATEGNRSWKRSGDVVVAIHTRPGTGEARALDLGRVVKETLEGKDLDGVIIRAMTTGESGAVGAWYFLVYYLSFEYYERR